MSQLWARRPSPALVISATALVVAVSSEAYAAVSGIPDAGGVLLGS